MTETNDTAVRTRKRALSLGASEGVGVAVSFASLALAKAVLGQKRMERLKHWAAEKIVLRFVDKADEAGLPLMQPDALPEAGGEPAGQPAFAPMTPEERAYKIASSAVDLTIMAPIGFVARLGVQKKMDDVFGVPAPMESYVFSRVVDNGVGVATLVGLNSVGKKQARSMTKSLSGVFTRLGANHETADSIAKFAVYAQIPNLTSVAANLATLHAMDKKQR